MADKPQEPDQSEPAQITAFAGGIGDVVTGKARFTLETSRGPIDLEMPVGGLAAFVAGLAALHPTDGRTGLPVQATTMGVALLTNGAIGISVQLPQQGRMMVMTDRANARQLAKALMEAARRPNPPGRRPH